MTKVVWVIEKCSEKTLTSFLNLNENIFQRLTLQEKMSNLKFKEKTSEEPASYKNLLFWMVRLIHADPMLMLNVRDKTIDMELIIKCQNGNL